MTKSKTKNDDKTTKNETVIRHRLSPQQRVRFVTTGNSRTKQSFKKACDINLIVKTYTETGITTHLNRAEPHYGFAPAIDFREALHLVRDAQGKFDDLSSDVRAAFDNDPARLMEFLDSDPTTAQLRAMGLVEPESAHEAAAAADTPPEGENTAPADSVPAKPGSAGTNDA